MSEKITFRVNIADLIFEIVCLYPSTYRLCRDYLTESGDPREFITITREDIDGERQRLLKKKNPGEALDTRGSGTVASLPPDLRAAAQI